MMAHQKKVMRSVNLFGDNVCVDVFMRPDGSFGFDEFRRDPEDTRGWYSIGHYGTQTFDSEQSALKAAIQTVDWLADQM
ncbi:MAG: hypothetical protein P8Q99_08575 [Paracoccaceae bacterium]|nr:hypothetical protein [Paracoccaceae bacterium]